MISPTSTTQGSVIHLVAPPSNRQDATAHYGRTVPCLLLAGAIKDKLTPPAPHSRTIIIGDTTAPSAASSLGLDYTDHFTPILSNPITIKRKLIAQLSNLQTAPTRVICWSDELIHLACAIAARLDVPTELISTKPSIIQKPPQNIDTIRVFEPQDHDRWLDHRHTCQTDQLLAATIDQEPASTELRASARARFDIDESAICLGAIADAPNEVDAREFAFLLGLLSVSGYKVLGIIPKTANKLNQALRHHRGLDKPFRLLTTTDPLPALLPILDACIHPTDEHSGSTHLIDRLCERADVPILHLRHSGKAGFSRAQGSSGRLLDQMDEIVKHQRPSFPQSPQPINA